MNIKFARLIHKISDFLIEIGNLRKEKKLRKKGFYYIPIDYLAEELKCPIDTLKKLPELAKYGIEIVEDEEIIVKTQNRYSEHLENKSIQEEMPNYPFTTAFDLKLSGANPNNKNNNNQIINNDNNNTENACSCNAALRKLKQRNYDHGLYFIKNTNRFIDESLAILGINKVLKLFDWKNFEEFIAFVLNNFGYHVILNFRFSIKKSNENAGMISRTTKKPQKRFEIDILGIKDRTILCIDAKYWRRKHDIGGSLCTSGNRQRKRAQILAKDKEAITKMFQSLGRLVSQKEIVKIQSHKIKNKDKSEMVSKHWFWIFPAIIYCGPTTRKINNQGVPLISLEQFPNFMQSFEQNRSYFVRYKVKSISIQSKLFD
ncbi:MAG: hypothetical protein GF364_20875 [Candidatus Lokiarchaeota archaeon]|nr:hypothetical protein [Candidatus Lokiarchaeota archaeon]